MSDDKNVDQEAEKEVRCTTVNFEVPKGKVTIVLDILNIHQAVGELEAIKQDVLDLERIPRKMKAMQEHQQKQALRGGTGVVNGLKGNKNLKI